MTCLQKFAVACLVGLSATAPLWAQDEITYRDRTTKEIAVAKGTIESENPSQIVFRPARGSGKEAIPAPDVIDVLYQVPQITVKLEYRKAMNLEAEAGRERSGPKRKGDLAAALKIYRELLPTVKEEKLRRYVEFKVAKLTALQAQSDPALVDDAIERLSKFKKDNAGGWELSDCTNLLAELQMEKKDWEGAQKTYEDLAAVDGISKDIRQNCELMVAQVLVRAQKYDKAKERLQALVKAVPPNSAQALRLRLSLAECQTESGETAEAEKVLKEIVEKAADPDVKATAYATLGDCHRLAKNPGEARWDYLWVDQVYHQDRVTHAKALFYLQQIFKELKNDALAKKFRDKLESTQFAGTEWQRRLTAEP